MTTADTSVVVAAFAPWHEAHDRARQALVGVHALVGHVIVETYSVLTRLPEPHRAPAAVVAEFLRRRFAEPALSLDAPAMASVPTRLAESGITGGATYDALIGLTAAHASMELITLDARAAPVYQRLGVSHRLIEAGVDDSG